MIGNFIYNSQESYIEVDEKNAINVASIMEGYRLIETNPQLPKQLNILIDARENGLNVKLNEVSEIVSAANTISDCFHVLKEAIILKHPKDTALATLIGLGLKQMNYHLRVFSTREAAIHWLMQ